MRIGLLAIFGLLVSVAANAQNNNVGIGTTTPDPSAILELQATDKGILIPRTDTNLVLAPATGLLIYETADNTFYYFDGTWWVPFGAGGGGSGTAWELTGNAGTTAGTNFIGTTDAQDFITKTAGSAAINERFRVTSGGKVVVNNTSSTAADIFSVYGTGTTGAINGLGTFSINGYSAAGGTGVYGENTGAGQGVWGANTAGGTGVFGSNSLNGQGVWGNSTGINGVGVLGQATNTSSNAGNFRASNVGNTFTALYAQHDGSGDAVTAVAEGTGSALTATNDALGVSSTSINPVIASFNYGTGAFSRAGNFQNDNTTNANAVLFAAHAGLGRIGEFQATNAGNASDGVFATHVNGNARVINAENQAVAGAGTGHTIRGITSQSNAVGVIGGNWNPTGTGIIGYGNNVTPSSDAAGSGGAFTGTVFGSVSFFTATTGARMAGSFRGTNLDDPGAFIALAGVDGDGNGWDDWVGGYFDDGTGSAFAYVGAWFTTSPTTGIARKIEGVGTVNTIITDLEDKPVLMSAPEAPENFFEDYGNGTLVNGKAHIDLDPIFAKNITVNEKHPLRVFIQLEGESKGVYVSAKTAVGFDVTELQQGVSNTRFMYHVIANRADQLSPNGKIAQYADERFAPAAKPLKIGSIKKLDNERKKPNERSKPLTQPTQIGKQVKESATPEKKPVE